jgi:hypothetical protein
MSRKRPSVCDIVQVHQIGSERGPLAGIVIDCWRRSNKPFMTVRVLWPRSDKDEELVFECKEGSVSGGGDYGWNWPRNAVT